MSISRCACGKVAVEGGLCRVHYIESKERVYLDNTNISMTQGILKWAHDFYPQYMAQRTPFVHMQIYKNLLSLYNPLYTNKYERLMELIAFRGSAKSTVANFIFPSYIIAHNGQKMKIKDESGQVIECLIDEGLIAILSETASSAEDFTVRIRDEFTTNETLRYFYSFAIEDALDSLTGQWTKAAFKINGTFVIGVGSGQQIRGKVKGASRPTLVLADDIYSEKNTLTPESRRKIRRWWNDGVMNSVDDVRGKVGVLGTIVHDDTVLVDLEKNDLWKTVKYSAMDHKEFMQMAKEHMPIDLHTGLCSLRFHDIKDERERLTKQKQYYDNLPYVAAWPERVGLYFLAIKYKEAVSNGTVNGFYQEYFHIIIPDDEKQFKKQYFNKLGEFSVINEYGYNWLRCDVYKNDRGEQIPKMVNIEFGLDIGGGGIDGDDTVVTVAGITEDRRRFVFHQGIGKYSIRDTLKNDAPTNLRQQKVVMDREFIERIGFVDELFRLAVRFHPSVIKIGIAGEEKLHLAEIRRLFEDNGMGAVMILPRPQTVQQGNKETRIKGTLLPPYQTMMVYHRSGLEKLEYQLEFLGKTKNDDCADSAEVSFYNMQVPSAVGYEFFNEQVKVRPKKRLFPGMSQSDFNAVDWRTLGN